MKMTDRVLQLQTVQEEARELFRKKMQIMAMPLLHMER